jgi:hypothetical protein
MEKKVPNRLSRMESFALCKDIDENRETFNGMKRQDIFETLRERHSFDFNLTHVENICAELNIEPSRKRTIKQAEQDGAILLDIVELIEEIVCAIDTPDLFSGDLAFAHKKIDQLKYILS